MTIDLGPDFPRSSEQIAQREEIEQYLINALFCVRHDPLGGNVRHCVEAALRVMGSEREQKAAALILDARSMLARITDELDGSLQDWVVGDLDEVRADLSAAQQLVWSEDES